jgi:hypothetical protein
VPGPVATLVLTPGAATYTVGTEQCLTADVRDEFTNPTAAIVVRFQVTGAVATGGAATTGSNGQAVFCYAGPVVPGTDTISAFADADNDATHDAGEPGGTAQKIWVAGPAATLTLTPGVSTAAVGSQHCVTAELRDTFANATPAVTVRFHVTGATSTSSAAATDANGQAVFCYTGPRTPGEDVIAAFGDSDNDGTQDAGEVAGTATKTWIAGSPVTLTLTPAAATNWLGEQHCSTVVLKDAFNNATPGITVRFQVSGAVNTSGSATTGASGEAMFCYTGPTVPGTDVITAFADIDLDAVQDAGEPAATAVMSWLAAPVTSECKVTGGGVITTAAGTRATFGGGVHLTDGVTRGMLTYVDHGRNPWKKILSQKVLSVVCHSATQATITGQAWVNGSSAIDYRIDVSDGGDSGTGDTYSIALSDGYASGVRPLIGGNIRID